MFKRIAQFFLWKHLRATLRISGVILAVAVIYRLAVDLFRLHSRWHLSAGTFAVLDIVMAVLGIISFFLVVICYMLYRRRKQDGSLDS
jgi:hypothetical protein